ncbi:RsmB/NOP family class I SAM-dependent RNA methyltransferase [Lutibacter sp.]|uniref:RsmB/NOP family class I SAM-dependent RNA methyltransferase n=1 Tax=Lutibacter sp. TaxID=1925666 RepID=UPI003561926E
MRLHRNLVYTVIASMRLIFNDEEYADKVVEKALKKDKRWGARDRKFVAETIYEMVRWKRLYNEIAGTKNHYTNENVWKNFAVFAILRGYKLPDWNQLQGVPERRIKGKFDELQKQRVFKESIPDWLDELAVKELGEKQWTKEIEALNIQASVILRTNTLNTNKLSLRKKLSEEGIETEFIPGHPDALKLVERANVFVTQCFKDGLFEVQDASSQLVAEYLDVKPGMKVIDTCAGAGGKTLHLAALMENKGQLIATDIYESKLRKLKIRTRRAGVFNVTTKALDTTKVLKKMKGTADRVLIDAPCSGIGVLRRNPDSKWKLQPEFIETIKATQAEILENYSQLVKVGGKLVYATCSILPSENENQVQLFLKNHPEFKFVKENKVSAHKSGFDGFYMALLEKIS